MACKLTILAGVVGGIPEVFSDGIEGVYWPLNNPIAAAKKLIALMEDTDTYYKMVEAAKVRFYANVESTVVASCLLTFLANQAFPYSGLSTLQ